jgi:hypothetical protein
MITIIVIAIVTGAFIIGALWGIYGGLSKKPKSFWSLWQVVPLWPRWRRKFIANFPAASEFVNTCLQVRDRDVSGGVTFLACSDSRKA